MLKNKMCQKNQNIKEKFPFFKQNLNVVYLDSAATTQKPASVINAGANYYKKHNFSVEGVHEGNIFLQKLMVNVRQKTLNFLDAGSDFGCVFTKSATESFNILAFGLTDILPKNPQILISDTEHHANILPWQRLAKKIGGNLDFVSSDFENGICENEIIEKAKNADLLSITHISNTTGQVLNLENIIQKIRKNNPKIIIVVDGSQAVSQLKINLKKLGADFYIFSAHKIYGPLGLGFLVGKTHILSQIEPFFLGGKMIQKVEKTCFVKADFPYFLEAGTPNGEVLFAFEKTLTFLKKYHLKPDFDQQKNYEYLQNELEKIENLQILSKKTMRKGVLSFVIKNVDNFDLGFFLSQKNILIRAGNHCCQPLMQSLKIEGTTRVSLGIYTTKEDIDLFIKNLKSVLKMLG